MDSLPYIGTLDAWQGEVIFHYISTSKVNSDFMQSSEAKLGLFLMVNAVV